MENNLKEGKERKRAIEQNERTAADDCNCKIPGLVHYWAI
jgi:hypothetical protein